jgi:hypothetical protein
MNNFHGLVTDAENNDEIFTDFQEILKQENATPNGKKPTCVSEGRFDRGRGRSPAFSPSAPRIRLHRGVAG